MQARYFDPRVGYFTVGYTDFDENPQGVERVSLVKDGDLNQKAKRFRKNIKRRIGRAENQFFI